MSIEGSFQAFPAAPVCSSTGVEQVGQGSFFEVEPGVKLYYEVSGEGPPLVFVPGWTFSTDVFDHQIAHFSRTHRVVTFVTGRDDEWTEMSVAQASEFYQAMTSPKGHRKLMAAFAQETLIQRKVTSEELNWIVGLSTRTPCWAAAAYDAAGNFSNYQREAEEIDRALPTLFIVAGVSRDRAKPYLETRLPKAQLESFGGHMMFWEFPERFNAVLEKFLQNCDR